MTQLFFSRPTISKYVHCTRPKSGVVNVHALFALCAYWMFVVVGAVTTAADEETIISSIRNGSNNEGVQT